MLRSPIIRITAGIILAIVALGLLRYKPWQRGGGQNAGDTNQARERLTVGFLPVT